MSDIEKQVDVKDTSSQRTPDSPIDHGVGDAAPYIDPVLEKHVLQKFDRWLLPQMMLLMLISNLDRSNIGKTTRERSLVIAHTNIHGQATLASSASRKTWGSKAPISTTSAPCSTRPTLYARFHG
jgi:hypothetical protein